VWQAAGAELYARERAVQAFGQLLREEAMAGRDPGPHGSIAWLAGAELSQFAATVASQVLDADAPFNQLCVGTQQR
jgi:hypothetical protein